MRFWFTVCRGVEALMRLGRVPDRRGQVWQKRMYSVGTVPYTPMHETVVVVGAPAPVQESISDKLVSDRPVWLRMGWCHRVTDLETGKSFDVNEAWFGEWSERVADSGGGWVRVT